MEALTIGFVKGPCYGLRVSTEEIVYAADATLAKADERVMRYARKARSANTTRIYKARWQMFVQWCEGRGVRPMPAEPVIVAEYLVALLEDLPRQHNDPRQCKRSSSTVAGHLAAIRKNHEIMLAMIDPAQRPADPTRHPIVQMTWEGIRRDLGVAPRERKTAASTDGLDRMLAATQEPSDRPGESYRQLRDRALLLLGFWGAFRRSELCALQTEDLRFETEGLIVTLRRSKTDQEGAGREVALPARPSDLSHCPVHAVLAWMRRAQIDTGPVFRGVRGRKVQQAPLHEEQFVRRIKQLARKAGLRPALFAGHSLRAGFVTASIQAGASPFSVMDVTGHKSYETLRRYVREAERWKDTAASKVVFR